MPTLIIDISPEALERARRQLTPKAKPSPRRLPGERHEFREMRARSTARDLTPAQHLDEHGNITSSRPVEVSRTDPLRLRIQELEAEVAALQAKLKSLTHS